MPTVTDYLQSVQGGTALVQVTVSTWVRLTNNLTTATFISQAASSAAGQFTVLNVPAGSYALATGPSNTGPWTTQDSNYIVGDSTLQYNAKDYGAKGDGSTDDSTAIQAAINAANTAGGGTVYFPAGTYIASALTFYGKIKYLGAGIENTILKLKNSTNTFLLQSNNFVSLTGGNTTGGEFNFQWQDLTLDGNKANNGSSTVPVIRIYGYGFSVRDVRIRNGNNEGWYSEWATSASSPGNDAMEAHVSGLKAHDCGSHGIHWNGPHDSDLVNGESFNNGARGIFVDANGNGAKFTSFHGWGLSQTYAWYLNTSGVELTNCVAEGASTAQVAINGADCQLIGMNVYASGGGTTGVIIGDTGSVSGSIILAKIMNCTTAAINFKNDGQSFVAVDVFQSSGSPTAGTISINTYLQMLVNGVAGSVYRFPNNLEIHAGNALKLFSSGDSGFATIAFNGSQVTNTWPWQQAAGTALQSGAGVQPGTAAGALQTGNLFMGSGVPSNSNGNNGDFYFRTDTPGTSSQRIYIKSAGSWTALTV